MRLPSDSAIDPARRPPSAPPPPWLGALLQVSDSAYPTGSFGHSGGLEGFAQLGKVRDAASLEHFVDHYVLHGLSHVDLPLLRFAREAAAAGDGDRLARLDNLSAALRTPEELRLAASRTGRQRLALLASVMHFDRRDPERWNRLVPRLAHTQAPVVAGLEAALADLPCEPAMQAYAFAALAATLGAALKILRMGQTVLQEILYRKTADLPDLVALALRIGEDRIGSFTPLLDIASARHKRAFSRLFLS